MFPSKRSLLSALLLGTLVLSPVASFACDPLVDVVITKTGPATASPGGTLTYTLRATVASGIGFVKPIMVKDIIPAGLIFQPQSTQFTTLPNNFIASVMPQFGFGGGVSKPYCEQRGPEVICIIPYIDSPKSAQETYRADVPVVTSVDIRLTYSVPPSLACATLQNTATIDLIPSEIARGYQIEINPSNNTSQTVITKVDCTNPDVSITKTGDATVTPGNQVRYSLLIKNNATSNAQSVIVSDAIPAGLTYFPATSDSRCIQQGSSVSCALGTMTGGQSITLPLVFNVPFTQVCSSSITNIASVATTSIDTNLGNNQSSAETLVTCPPPQADVSIQKTTLQTSVNRGQSMHFDLSIRNNGPATAQSVTVSDPIPAGLTVSSISDNRCAVTGASITCNFGNMTSGQVIPVSIIYQTSAQTVCTTITNRATVSTVTAGDSLANNEASAQMLVTCPSSSSSSSSSSSISSSSSSSSSSTPSADLFVQKSGPTSAQQGSIISYSIIAGNNGPAITQSVTVSDAIPSGLTYLPSSSDSRCNQQGTSIVCNVGTLASGQQLPLNLSFQSQTPSSNCTQQTVTNIVTINSVTQDLNTSNNTSSFSTQMTCPVVVALCPQISISIKDSPEPVQAGEEITYEIKIENDASVAQKINIVASLDDDMSFVNASNSGDDNDDEVEWKNLNLTANDDETLELRVRVSSSVRDGDQVQLKVESECDSDSENTTVTGQTVTLTPPNLSITKTADRSEAQAGDTVNYVVTLRNIGSSTINSVILDDRYDNGEVSVVDATGGSINGTSIRWTLGSMAPNAEQSVRYTALMGSNMRHGDLVQNTACFSTDTALSGCASAIVSIIKIVPQTGVGYLGDTGSKFLRPAKSGNTHDDASAPISVIVLTLTGLAIGGGIGKKLFQYV